MNFIGRQREIAAIIKSLKQNRNVVLAGRYGVGRSCLIKHISKLCSATWQFLFADFSKTAARSCNEMVNQLASERNKAQRHRYTRLIHAKDVLIGKKVPADLPRVIVLDNIGKISRQKLAFIRDLLLGSDLLFVAIIESFLPEADLFQLRSTLHPSDLLTLHNLKRKETAAFFRNFSQKKRLEWSEHFIQMLAASAGGYALMMKEIAQREAELTLNAKNLFKTRRP
jgi:AAA ATPase domain